MMTLYFPLIVFTSSFSQQLASRVFLKVNSSLQGLKIQIKNSFAYQGCNKGNLKSGKPESKISNNLKILRNRPLFPCWTPNGIFTCYGPYCAEYQPRG